MVLGRRRQGVRILRLGWRRQRQFHSAARRLIVEPVGQFGGRGVLLMIDAREFLAYSTARSLADMGPTFPL